MPLTIRLDDELERTLDDYCRATGRSRSDVVRDAIRRPLTLFRFQQFRREFMPYAEAEGLLADEDVFRAVS